ncbi:peptidase S41 [Salinibacter sp. 10B]|uniref:S41 family peptidase n=1 Tax=Salinibacter sp. 10B TaxID=1923971 RepID=UPI000D2A009D|nr:S41 family peptidase [Salinibacter sp. 10B]PQJ34334.1 peptidase S41 [Salinibacter sp. 10B]
MQLRFATAVFLLALFVGPALAQTTDPFMRHPAVHPEGNQVAFSYQGDLWTVPVDGGRAERLTIHEAYEGTPRWRPNGEQIAFTSDRYGNDDVYLMDAEGGTPQRLTYHSTDDALSGWTPNGHLLFTTRRTYAQAEWLNEIYQVPAEGGTPNRRLDAVGAAPRMSPDGRFIAFEQGYNDTSKKGYQGPADREVWIYDTENDRFTRITSYGGNDHHPVWTGPRTLLYISERSGTYNVHRQAITDQGGTDGAPEAVTSFEDDGVRALSASADGRVIAFERQTDIYVMENGGEPRQLDVTVPADYRFDPTEQMEMSNGVRDYAVSPNGEQVALVLRGELFLMQNETDEPRTTRLTEHAYRDRDVTWTSDSTLVFVSDRNGGQYDLYRLESADSEHPGDLYDALQYRVTRLTDTPENERILSMGPDRSRIALRRGSMTSYGEGQLLTATLSADGLTDEAVLVDGWNAPTDVSWSPDGEWLAYSKSNLNFNSDIYIHAADGSREPVNVSQHPRGDSAPVWSPDGSKLGFVSERSAAGSDVWFVWLQEEDWEKTERDWEEIEENEAENGAADAGDSDESETPSVEIDFENIHDRLERVTALPGNEGEPVIGEDGETFYFVAGGSGWAADYDTEVDLYSIQWDGSERTRITEGGVEPSNVRLAPTGTQVTFTHSNGQIARVPTEKPDLERLAFQATMEVNHEKEREQIFTEVGRALQEGFYDPNFHGDDWDSLRTKYRPWALQASTTQDFQDAVNLMLGELNASHMGYYGGDRAETQNERTGRIGVEVDPVDNGVEVQRVVPRSPAARETSTLREGDVITTVNGTSVAEAGNFYALMEGTVKEKVLLRVTGPDGEERTVRIRPTDDLQDELYREWVEERKRLVEEYSNGRLGYIHVEGMNWESFEHFERELYASAHDKEGLIIDVRFNGGGWTTDYLMTVLNVRRHAYTVPRGATDNLQQNHKQFREHYPFGERLPYAAWTKPTATLANENSYSNAEIFSHAFKNLGHGPLVGQPTFGAVISTGGTGLLDGSYVRMPFRAWYVYQTDENMEHGPARPDISVQNPPAIKAEGEDPQLRRAVESLLEEQSEGEE